MLFSPSRLLAHSPIDRADDPDAAFLRGGVATDGDRSSARKAGARRQTGFTLIELMVVVMILGVLAALVVPRVMSRPDQARVVAARADIARIDQQLKLYRLDNNRYPTTEQGLQALVTRPSSGPQTQNWKQYLDKVPLDPWGNPYQYLSPGLQGRDFEIFSLGADGQPGGVDFDADISSAEL